MDAGHELDLSDDELKALADAAARALGPRQALRLAAFLAQHAVAAVTRALAGRDAERDAVVDELGDVLPGLGRLAGWAARAPATPWAAWPGALVTAAWRLLSAAAAHAGQQHVAAAIARGDARVAAVIRDATTLVHALEGMAGEAEDDEAWARRGRHALRLVPSPPEGR